MHILKLCLNAINKLNKMFETNLKNVERLANLV